MIPLFSHKRYARSALACWRRHGGLRTDHRHYHGWLKLKETDLDHAYLLLATLCSHTLAGLGRDPVSMLRSCLAMKLYVITSFTAWVGMIRDEHFCALIGGFLVDCNRHDGVHCIAALYRASETLGLFLQTASLDATHDVLGLFRLAAQRWHMVLVVPLNERNKDNLHYADPLRLEKGDPICQAGLPVKRWGFCPDRLRLKGCCPLAAAKKTPKITTCTHFTNGCSDSLYGRVLYTFPTENYRLHTLLPRDGNLWDLHRRPHRCRTLGQTQEKRFPSPRDPHRSPRCWFFRVMLAAICQHIGAWVTHAADRSN